MARGVTTEWEDLQVAKGNWKPRDHVPTGEEIFQTQQEGVQDYDNFANLNAKQIEEKIEDDWDLEDDEVMQAYRAKRMQQMKEQAAQYKFNGSVYEITKQDYEHHVQSMPKDTLGVIHLYQDQ